MEACLNFDAKYTKIPSCTFEKKIQFKLTEIGSDITCLSSDYKFWKKLI